MSFTTRPTSASHTAESPTFVPGLELCRQFYEEAVRPIMDRRFPGLAHGAGRLEAGSEVLGFDTARSTDHEWGPRLQIFLADGDHAAVAPAIAEALRHALPREIRGYPTGFGPTDEDGTRVLRPVAAGQVDHKVEVTTLAAFLEDRLGVSGWHQLDPVD